MHRILEAVIDNSRVTLCILLMVVLAGSVARSTINVEADADITIPLVMVVIPHIGISPEDADRLIVRPMESEVRSIEGVKEVSAFATEGAATLMLEFDIDFDSDDAIAEVRAAVDRGQSEIPGTAEEPIIKGITISDFPVIAISLTSDTVPERVRYNLAVDLKYELESLPEVLEARLSGHREELLEAVIDPLQLEHYAVSQQEMFAAVRNNNSLIAAGAMDTGQGRFAIKVPGLIESSADVFSLPIKSNGDIVVTLDKIAEVRRTFKDRDSYTRVNGKPALTVEVLRRPGANVIDLNQKVRELVAEKTKSYPQDLTVIFSQDQSGFAKEQVSELQGNIVTAMALVMVMVVAAMGLRSGKTPMVVDATAGLGRDSFLLASLGAQVTMIERSEKMHGLLVQGMKRAAQEGSEFREIIGRMTLLKGDAKDLLLGMSAEVILIDPMHPPRTNSALVKRELRQVREIVGTDEDAADLVMVALQNALSRVVLKWPAKADPITGIQPCSHQIVGKSTRYDVFMLG